MNSSISADHSISEDTWDAAIPLINIDFIMLFQSIYDNEKDEEEVEGQAEEEVQEEVEEEVDEEA